jgi:hypothetical protein
VIWNSCFEVVSAMAGAALNAAARSASAYTIFMVNLELDGRLGGGSDRLRRCSVKEQVALNHSSSSLRRFGPHHSWRGARSRLLTASSRTHNTVQFTALCCEQSAAQCQYITWICLRRSSRWNRTVVCSSKYMYTVRIVADHSMRTWSRIVSQSRQVRRIGFRRGLGL